jgi:hypothetical protein
MPKLMERNMVNKIKGEYKMKTWKQSTFIGFLAILVFTVALVACDDWFDATLIIENHGREPYNVRVSSYGKPSGGWTLINGNGKASFRVESGNVITIELYTNVFHTVSPLAKGEERIYILGSLGY